MSTAESCLLALGVVAAACVAARAAVEPEFVVAVNAADFLPERDIRANEGTMTKTGTRAELDVPGDLVPVRFARATYALKVEASGSYDIWLTGGGSGHFGKSIYSWSLDGSEFRPASNNALVTPATNLQAFNDRLIELVRAADLKAGEHRLALRVEFTPGERTIFTMANVGLAKAWNPEHAKLRPGIALRGGDRVCFIGDSITTGGYYIQNVAAVLARAFPQAEIRFYNCDSPGDTTSNAVPRFERDVLAMKPSWVVIALSINDVRDIPLYRYLRNMRDMIVRAKAGGARVMLMTPTVYDEDPAKQPKDAAGYIAEMLNNEAVRYHNRALSVMAAELAALAKEHDCLVADVYTPFRRLVELRAQGGSQLDLLPDRLHPSPEGHAVLAIAVLKAFGLSNEEIAAGLAVPQPITDAFGLPTTK